MSYSNNSIAVAQPHNPLARERDLRDDRFSEQKPAVPKIIRPIARRVNEFYHTAKEQGISTEEVQAAIAYSLEWHRKWTLQEETGHGLEVTKSSTLAPFAELELQQLLVSAGANEQGSPDLVSVDEGSSYCQELSEEDEPESALPEETEAALEGAVCLYGCLFDRYSGDGALNPSPVFDLVLENKTIRGQRHFKHTQESATMSLGERSFGSLSALSNDEQSNESLESYRSKALSKRLQVKQLQQPPLVRPIAIRVTLPEVAFTPPEPLLGLSSYDGDYPRHVFHSVLSSLSPLTLPSDVSHNSGSTSTTSAALPTAQVQAIEEPELFAMAAAHVPLSAEVQSLSPSHAAPLRPVAVSPCSITEVSAARAVAAARDGLLHALASAGGEVTLANGEMGESIQILSDYYHSQMEQGQPDARQSDATCGLWLTLTKPTFFGCLGETDQGDPMYTLGRMSFDMFSPTNLVCSLQGNFNSIETVTSKSRQSLLDKVPKSLKQEVEAGATVLRTYNIVTAFTIEPSSAAFPSDTPNKHVTRPIRGLMTTYGYILPDPDTPNRHSVWITGGRIEPNNDPTDVMLWKRQFQVCPPTIGFGQAVKQLAVKMLMGAEIEPINEQTGDLSYKFTRPLGGHGMAYVDTLYCDESLRVVRGHRGTVFVFSKIGSS